MTGEDKIFKLLASLYGEERAPELRSRIDDLLQDQKFRKNAEHRVTHADTFLITYGDQIREQHRPPLKSLHDFCGSYLKDLITAIHLLPFYPYSSDDGFSVVDYRTVDPVLGDWQDISRLGLHFRLMFDAVVNHVSAKHEWFERFLAGDPGYQDYFIVIRDDPDLSQVVRPRTLPLLTPFSTSEGSRKVWSTFSEDQIDLNFRNPEVLLEILSLLLFYVSHGASFLRLDAVAFLWKEVGTSSIHLPQTHWIIQLFRAVLDQVALRVLLITETNVPHAENISYFGDGENEAQMVYNFALPPLLLHTLHTGKSGALSRWANSLKLPSDKTTFFNFLASHDGIGVNPVRGILSENEIKGIVSQCVKHGGLVSYKRNPDGTESPYELNINYFDALSDPASGEPIDLQVNRFLAAHAILLSLIGVPAIYFHSLLGSRSWAEGPSTTGRNRSINRQKLLRSKLESELEDPESLRSKVFAGLQRILRVRREHPAFDPYGSQQIIECGPSVFAVLRTSQDTKERILCIQNVTAQSQTVTLPGMSMITDLLDPGSMIDTNGGILRLSPYQEMWIQLLSNSGKLDPKSS